MKPGTWAHSVCLSPNPSPLPPGVSRGPSPVVLGSQDALPVATAFTEYVHAYFRSHSPRYTEKGDSSGYEGANTAPWGLCLWVPAVTTFRYVS